MLDSVRLIADSSWNHNGLISDSCWTYEVNYVHDITFDKQIENPVYANTQMRLHFQLSLTLGYRTILRSSLYPHFDNNVLLVDHMEIIFWKYNPNSAARIVRTIMVSP